jgi:hypothetical protein
MVEVAGYKFVLFYLAFLFFIFGVIILAGKNLPESLLTKEGKEKIEKITTDMPNPTSGIQGFLIFGSRQIEIFLTLMTVNSPLRILSIIFIIFNIVALFIFAPHIINFIRVFTDFIGNIASNPIVGSIIAIGALVTIGGVVLSFLLPSEPNPKAYDACLSCIRNGTHVWAWCDAILKNVMGCVKKEDFQLFKQQPFNTNNTCGVFIQAAEDIEGCKLFQKSAVAPLVR